MKNYTIVSVGRENIAAIKTLTGEVIYAKISMKLLSYYASPNCNCGMIYAEGMRNILVSGQDECPAHSFQGGLSYKKSTKIEARLTQEEIVILDRLRKFYECNQSEAVRRALHFWDSSCED